MSVSNISKTRLVNLSTPDTNISELHITNPRLHQAIKNMSLGSKQLINNTFPRYPRPQYRGRIIIPGVVSTGTDILVHPYHVVMPIDPDGNWIYNNIVLQTCYISAKIPPATTPLSIDILMSQKKGTSVFKSLFKPSSNPTLPVNLNTTHDVMFEINSLHQDDIGRVDILTADNTVANIEVVLSGYYKITEVSVK